MKNLSLLTAILLVAACGDNLDAPGVDASPPEADAAPDAPVFVTPTPFALAMSAAGPDQLLSATAGPDGSFYAAGYAAPDLTGAKAVVVAKLTPTGALDPTFGGGDGLADTGLVFKGGVSEIDVATQADGKLVVSATVAAAATNAMDAADTDIAVTRLEADGDVDTSFGTGGKLVINLNESFLDTTPDPDVVRGRDGVRSLAIATNDTIYLQALQRGEGLISGGSTDRIDTEFAVVRVTAGGALDTAYGAGDGTFVLDIFAQNTHSDATPHGIHVNADGTVIANGYAKSAATGGTVQPVLYKVNAAGTALDTSFAEQGLFHEVVLAMQTEIYGVAVHGNAIVTAGYGRNSGSANDWISMKFDATTGVRDTTWGPLNGTVAIDPSGTMAGNNCRNAVALPNGSTVLIGSAGPAAGRDAAFAVLTSTGSLDPAFGDGVHTFDLGGGEDQYWGGAVSNGKLLLVGWKGGGASPSATMNDDAYGVLMPVLEPLQ